MASKKVSFYLDVEKQKYPLISMEYGWHFHAVIHDVPLECMNIIFWGKDQKNKIRYRYIKVDISFLKEYFDFSSQEKNINTSGFKTLEEQFGGVLFWSDEARNKLHGIALIAAQLFDFLESSQTDWSLEYDIANPNLETVLTKNNFKDFMDNPLSFYLDERNKLNGVHMPELMAD